MGSLTGIQVISLVYTEAPFDKNIRLAGQFSTAPPFTYLDPTAGFVCYRKEVLEAINLDGIEFVGYAFQIEMKFAAWKLGFKIVEVPITFIDREFGASKMNKGIIKEGVLGVLKLRWHSLFKNYRKRVTNTEFSNKVSFNETGVALESK